MLYSRSCSRRRPPLELLELLQATATDHRAARSRIGWGSTLGRCAATSRRLQKARDPGRGPARRRRRLPHSSGLPAAAAHAHRRRGGRGRARGAGGRAARRLGLRGRGRGRAREDPPRPARRTAIARSRRSRRRSTSRAARGEAHPSRGERCCSSPTPLDEPTAANDVSHLLGRRDAAEVEPARPRRPLRPLVPGRARPPTRRPADVPGRPHARGVRQ